MTTGVGILGSGYMGRTYAHCLAKHTSGGRLVAVSGGTRAPELARDFGAGRRGRRCDCPSRASCA